MRAILIVFYLLFASVAVWGEEPIKPIASVEEGIWLVQSFKGEPQDFKLAIPESLMDPVGMNIAIITNEILQRGWMPGGVVKHPAYRVFTYKKFEAPPRKSAEPTRPATELGALCEMEGPESLKPESFGSIRIGMTRAQVEMVLGKEKYSPIDGQDCFSTPGECEVAPDRMAGCGYVIEYRDYSKKPVEDTGRVMSCRWGGIGE